MNDDVLRAVWLSVRSTGDRGTSSAPAADAILRVEGLMDRHERRVRIALAAPLILLCPALLWAGAHGVTPLVRGAYSLMAVGVGVVVYAEWLWLRWSRQRRPGTADTRSQLRTAVFVLLRQADLLKSALLWWAPIFAGVLMIAYWIARERSVLEGSALAVVGGLSWAAAAVLSFDKSREIDERRSRMEAILTDLSSSES